MRELAQLRVRAFLPDQTRVSQVHLRTANLKRALAFYSGVLGLSPLPASGRRAVLSAATDGPGLIVFSEEQDAPQRPPRSTGLYLLALRYPDRQALAQAYRRVVKSGYPVDGASDHGVSEAIYLSDPEGNGVELYADRPRTQWYRGSGQVPLVTRPLNLDAVLALVADEPTMAGPPPETDIGHVHMRVADLEAARRFYGEFLGFTVTQRSYADALFFAAGGYHHHIGVNVWAGKDLPPVGSVGLISYRFEVPVAEILYCLGHRAPLLGYETRTEWEGDGPPILQIRDPNGVWLEVQPPPSATAFEPGSVCCTGHESVRISALSQRTHRTLLERKLSHEVNPNA